jgi:hypothetical protein
MIRCCLLINILSVSGFYVSDIFVLNLELLLVFEQPQRDTVDIFKKPIR